MNKYILSIIFILLTLLQIAFSEAAAFNRVPPQLQSIVSKMLEMPEARELLHQVSQEGSVGIVVQNDANSNFEAFWDGDARLIRLNSSRHSNEGSWICSILFELHNAKSNSHMQKLYRLAGNNQISKEAWVEQMERMEHANALNTCRLLDLGIAKGLFPREAAWVIFSNFNDYYKLQQITNHSQWLAAAYDQSNPYSQRLPFQGTISGLNNLTAEDKKDLQEYLVIKNNLESKNQQEALKSMAWVKAENTRLKECSQGRRQGCYRTQEKLKLMRLVFN